jgi:hypothetical protein
MAEHTAEDTGSGTRDARSGRTTPAARRRRRSAAVSATLGYSPGHDLAAARVALDARISAVRKCLLKRSPWTGVQHEITELLDGAATLLAPATTEPSYDGLERLRASVAQYRMAQKAYHGYVQKANRLLYVAGVLISILGIVVMVVGLYAAAHTLAEELDDPVAKALFGSADLPSMLILGGFAGLGSLASVVTRLERLVIPSAYNWELVFFAGAGRPLVAAVFAMVAYALIHGGIIPLQPVGKEIVAGGPYWWCVVVAFLCGYSERFASDLLGRSPFGGGEDAVAAPAAVGADVARARKR